MIEDALLGLGLVAVLEGLLLALAPDRIASVLETLQSLGPDRVRLVGLAAVGLGVALVWAARA